MVNNATDFKCVRMATHNHLDGTRKNGMIRNNGIFWEHGTVLKYNVFWVQGVYRMQINFLNC